MPQDEPAAPSGGTPGTGRPTATAVIEFQPCWNFGPHMHVRATITAEITDVEAARQAVADVVEANRIVRGPRVTETGIVIYFGLIEDAQFAVTRIAQALGFSLSVDTIPSETLLNEMMAERMREDDDVITLSDIIAIGVVLDFLYGPYHYPPFGFPYGARRGPFGPFFWM
jgi:hypothetical protein